MKKLLTLAIVLASMTSLVSCGKKKKDETAQTASSPVKTTGLKNEYSLNAPNLGQCWTVKMHFSGQVESMMTREHFNGQVKSQADNLKNILERVDSEAAYVSKCATSPAIGKCEYSSPEQKVSSSEINPKTEMIIIFKTGSVSEARARCFNLERGSATATFTEL